MRAKNQWRKTDRLLVTLSLDLVSRRLLNSITLLSFLSFRWRWIASWCFLVKAARLNVSGKLSPHVLSGRKLSFVRVYPSIASSRRRTLRSIFMKGLTDRHLYETKLSFQSLVVVLKAQTCAKSIVAKMCHRDLCRASEINPALFRGFKAVSETMYNNFESKRKTGMDLFSRVQSLDGWKHIFEHICQNLLCDLSPGGEKIYQANMLGLNNHKWSKTFEGCEKNTQYYNE